MIEVAAAQAVNHVEEQLLWSWTTLACLAIGWISHMLLKIIQWQATTGNRVPIKTYLTASWTVTAFSLLMAIGLYIVLPELGAYLNLKWLSMTPLSALLIGFNSDSVADLAGKRLVGVIAAQSSTPPVKP
jgi:hypothetical protein